MYATPRRARMGREGDVTNEHGPRRGERERKKSRCDAVEDARQVRDERRPYPSALRTEE